MSNARSNLPEQPSLQQLRKQAKEFLQLLRRGDPSAAARLRKYKTTVADPLLADVQFALAREYGFDSWPKLVRHIQASLSADLQQHQRIAEDLVAAYNSADPSSISRLNDLFHSSLNVEQIRDFIRGKISSLPDAALPTENFTLPDAQLFVARLYGFQDWKELVQSSNAEKPDLRSAPVVLSSRPPFYRIDWTTNCIEPRQPMSIKNWEKVCDVIKELGLTAVNSANLIGDDDLEIISHLDQITSLNLGDSKRITDKGLKYLARMPQLRELNLSGQITDRGLESLQQLRELRAFRMYWQNGITDKGISNLKLCSKLEEVDLLGCSTGDGAISALTEKPNLRRFKTGRNVTDDGLQLLHDFPAFKSWQGGDVKYGLMSFSGEPTNLLIDGPFTGDGLASLRGLDGLFGLSFFWHTSRLRGNDLRFLDGLSSLGYLGLQGKLCNDEAMDHIATLPKLRMLMGQGTVATDEGFRSLSRSQTIEYFWGRDCPNLGSAGFAALSEMQVLKGLAVSCKFVSDEALAKLPDFPSLKELMPMDVRDDGFRHIGRCERLESLILMYCRDTTDIATSHIADMAETPRWSAGTRHRFGITLHNLKKYHAGYTLITDRSLEMLSRMNSLEELSFEGCRFISDHGITFLTTLPRLRQISIGGCPQVTRTGVTNFGSDVRVTYDPW